MGPKKCLLKSCYCIRVFTKFKSFDVKVSTLILLGWLVHR